MKSFREIVLEQSPEEMEMEMYSFLKKKFHKNYRYYSGNFKEDETIKYKKGINILVNHEDRLYDYEWI